MTLVALQAHGSWRALADEGSIVWERRGYRPSDLEGAFLVIAATADSEVNIAVHEDAEARAMLVNVVDVPPLCNFILPRSSAAGRSRSRSRRPARRRRSRSG